MARKKISKRKRSATFAKKGRASPRRSSRRRASLTPRAHISARVRTSYGTRRRKNRY